MELRFCPDWRPDLCVGHAQEDAVPPARSFLALFAFDTPNSSSVKIVETAERIGKKTLPIVQIQVFSIVIHFPVDMTRDDAFTTTRKHPQRHTKTGTSTRGFIELRFHNSGISDVPCAARSISKKNRAPDQASEGAGAD
jgi:hypothetical protein